MKYKRHYFSNQHGPEYFVADTLDGANLRVPSKFEELERGTLLECLGSLHFVSPGGKNPSRKIAMRIVNSDNPTVYLIALSTCLSEAETAYPHRPKSEEHNSPQALFKSAAPSKCGTPSTSTDSMTVKSGGNTFVFHGPVNLTISP